MEQEPDTDASSTNSAYTPEDKQLSGLAGGVMFLCFLPWVSVSTGNDELDFSEFVQGANANGFNSWQGVIIFVAALTIVAGIFATRAGIMTLAPKTAALAPLAAGAVGAVCWLMLFGQGGTMSSPAFSISRTVWFYLCALLLGLTCWRAFQRWQAWQSGQ